MREIEDGVTWIDECYDLGGTHEHVSVFLVHDAATDEFALVDSGSFYHREAIAAQVEEATGGRGIDALILSHSDYPHSGNIREFKTEGDAVELVASSGSPLAQGLPPDAIKAEIGGRLEIIGRTWSFIDPPLADRSHTTWIYDHGSGGLFTADGFGSYHAPGECDMVSSDFADGIPAEEIYRYHRDTLTWLRYVDPAKLEDTLRSILDEFDVAYVAPVHGHPIVGDDLDRFLERLLDAATRIAGDYEVPEPR